MTTKLVNVETIGSYFESLSDPRHTRNRKHLLVDIVVIAVCGILCGSDGPTAIHRWADNRRDWLQQFLSLPNGIPSRDCIRRLLMALKPEAFQGCFQDWLAHVIQTDNGGPKRLIAIDGKTCRGSHDAAKQLGPLHIVSAWASEEGIALGQVATEAKSNEITAIPELLKQIELKDSLITIDAMGCQKRSARNIVDGGGDFVINLKDNQPKLREAIEAHFNKHLELDLEYLQYRSHETSESSHGRIDERTYFLTKIPLDFALRRNGPGSKPSATHYGLHSTRTAVKRTKRGITFLAVISAASDSARRSAVIGRSSRCIGYWM